MKRLLWLLAAVVLAVTEASPPRPETTKIRIPVWLDSEPEHALTPADFRASVDGTQSRILALESPKDDLVLLLVLDLSSGDLSVIDPAKQTLLDAIRKLPAKTFVGLLRDDDGLRVLQDPTPDREVIANEISLPTLTGHPGVLSTVDTLERIGDAMLKKSAVRVAILYVTDGDVHTYREDFTNPVINSSDPHDLSRKFPEVLVQEKVAKLTAVLASQQTPLFIVDLGQRTDRLNQAYHNGLKQLAETTGGAAFFSTAITEIPAAIQKSFETVESHYSLTVSLPERVSSRIQIRLTGPEGGKPASYRMHLTLPKR